MTNEKIGAVLVVGGGIGGMQASLDLADSGFKVYLLEEKPAIGGVMAQLDKTFPTNDCSMCIMSPKLVDVGRHPNIELITYSELEEVTGKAGNFRIKILKKPRYVDEEKCTGCGVCTNNCPVRYVPYISKDRFGPPVTLAPEDLEKVNKIIDIHREERAPLLSVLQDINTEYNYLPEDVLKYTSQLLNQPLSTVYNIATFYNAFSLIPRGRHTISVCLGTACYVHGTGKILSALERELGISVGETTEDKRFSLETVRCLGCCSLSPVIRIDEDIHGRLKVNKLRAILKEYD
ncbi:MAG: NAD(P)H-dependent oxidoreductase subunit E [Thermoplasmata archaeon]|nr:NAD(P)H-dependent oxidoreductase subunit E [Thermoplasmata archaeon]